MNVSLTFWLPMILRYLSIPGAAAVRGSRVPESAERWSWTLQSWTWPRRELWTTSQTLSSPSTMTKYFFQVSNTRRICIPYYEGSIVEIHPLHQNLRHLGLPRSKWFGFLVALSWGAWQTRSRTVYFNPPAKSLHLIPKTFDSEVASSNKTIRALAIKHYGLKCQ